MRKQIAAAAFGITLLIVGVSRADLVPPDVWACNGLQLGAACSCGICRSSTCEGLDYSHGIPPTPYTYACLRCVPAPPAPVPAETIAGLLVSAGVIGALGILRVRAQQRTHFAAKD